MKSSAEIRQEFLDYFKAQDHAIVKSAPCVPNDDPTLLFTNAGMNQFKDVFLGTGSRDYSRAADTQKCIRAGGKHNDLEEVGYDTYHHTFFEMLGNWSFGDYYKKESISWAWELLTERWGLPKEKLYATVYRTDDEADELWKSCTDINHEHILRFDEKDNFWEMGATGPCGPCSEIHIDLGAKACDKRHVVGHRCAVNGGCAAFIELWNLVFIQSERMADGSLKDLPRKHVDTGMGLERIVAVLQGVASNYDTDIFRPLIDAIVRLTGSSYGSGSEGVPHRAIADHMRAVAFSLADGGDFDNKGRGYVIRRILRRASRFLHKLGRNEPTLCKLVRVLAEQLGEVFPELKAQEDLIAAKIKDEEEKFLRTLDRGVCVFERYAEKVEAAGEVLITGDMAWDLYQTFGFPRDLTEQMAAERNLNVDIGGFEGHLAAEQDRGARTQTFNRANLGEFAELPASDFRGYVSDRVEEATVLRAMAGALVLDSTPFYPEGGGPRGDSGVISSVKEGGFEFLVQDTQKDGGIIVHQGYFAAGKPEDAEGVRVIAAVDSGRRDAIKRNHTGTHILHWALKEVLGAGPNQKGSVVKAEGFTFDFSFPHALTRRQIVAIERLVNERIMVDASLFTEESSFDEAKERGAVALFGQKYGEKVRVVAIGDGYSTELCGGIHVHRTGEIGSFKIIRETAVSTGIRRIEAVTGAFATEHSITSHEIVVELSRELKVPVSEIVPRVQDLFEQIRSLRKEAKASNKAQAVNPKELMARASEHHGIQLLIESVEGGVDTMRRVGDSVKSKATPAATVLLSPGKKGVAVLVACSQSLVERGWSANEIIRDITSVLGGGGGGRDDLAQGKGRDVAKVDEALERARSTLVAKTAV